MIPILMRLDLREEFLSRRKLMIGTLEGDGEIIICNDDMTHPASDYRLNVFLFGDIKKTD